MSAEFLEQIETLPPEKQQEVKDFVAYLIAKYPGETSVENIAAVRRSLAGRNAGKIWMAEDFDQTPDDFKDYM